MGGRGGSEADSMNDSADRDPLIAFLRQTYDAKRLWIHLILLIVLFVVSCAQPATLATKLAASLAAYVFCVAFTLYALLGWKMLRGSEEISITLSVAFIVVCWGLSLTMVMLSTSEFRQVYWLGLIWPILGYAVLFPFLKLLRALRRIRTKG